MGPQFADPMILLEGVQCDFGCVFSSDQFIDEGHVLTPVPAFFATFLELDQHLLGSGVILRYPALTLRQSRQRLKLNLI